MNEFKVTFTENKKYNPVTRTVSIQTVNAFQALLLAQRQYGKKKVNITSVIDEKGGDFLNPVHKLPTVEVDSAITDVSTNTDDIKVTIIPEPVTNEV